MSAQQADSDESVVRPPSKSRWQLITAGVLLAIWISFLVWMAVAD